MRVREFQARVRTIILVDGSVTYSAGPFAEVGADLTAYSRQYGRNQSPALLRAGVITVVRRRQSSEQLRINICLQYLREASR